MAVKVSSRVVVDTTFTKLRTVDVVVNNSVCCSTCMQVDGSPVCTTVTV
jgi:hypothetical protein